MSVKKQPSVRGTQPKMLDKVQCAICIHTFETPRILPCGHNLCTECLRQFLISMTVRTHFGPPMACPLCRQNINVPDKSKPVEDWVNQFPINRTLVEVIEETNMHEHPEVSEPPPSLCTEHRKRIQIFCLDHDQFGCTRCLKDKHRKCNFFDIDDEDGIHDACREVHTNVDNAKRELENRLAHYSNDIDNIALERDSLSHFICQFTDNVNQCLAKIKMKIEDSSNEHLASTLSDIDSRRTILRQKIQHLDTASSLVTFYEKQENKVSELAKAVTKAKDAVTESSTHQADKDVLIPSLKVANAEKFENIIVALNELLTENVVTVDMIDIENTCPLASPTVNATEQDLQNNLALTSSDYVSKSSTLSHSTSLEAYQPLWFRDAKFAERIDLRGEKYNSDITSILVRSDNEFILVDHGNDNMKSYVKDENFAFKKKWLFSSRPWGITMLADSNQFAAVSFPYKRLIAVVDIDNEKAPIRTFLTQHKCFGLASCKDMIVATTFDDGSYVLFIKTNGHLVNKICLNELGNPFMQKPISVRSTNAQSELIVACLGNQNASGSLVYLSEEGNVRNIFTAQTIKRFYCCDIDADSNVYVCDNNASKVHVIAQNGDVIKTLLSSNDGIYMPRHIQFFPSGDRFALSDTSNYIKIYQLSFDK